MAVAISRSIGARDRAAEPRADGRKKQGDGARNCAPSFQFPQSPPPLARFWREENDG